MKKSIFVIIAILALVLVVSGINGCPKEEEWEEEYYYSCGNVSIPATEEGIPLHKENCEKFAGVTDEEGMDCYAMCIGELEEEVEKEWEEEVEEEEVVVSKVETTSDEKFLSFVNILIDGLKQTGFSMDKYTLEEEGRYEGLFGKSISYELRSPEEPFIISIGFSDSTTPLCNWWEKTATRFETLDKGCVAFSETLQTLIYEIEGYPFGIQIVSGGNNAEIAFNRLKNLPEILE